MFRGLRERLHDDEELHGYVGNGLTHTVREFSNDILWSSQAIDFPKLPCPFLFFLFSSSFVPPSLSADRYRRV